MAPSIDRDTLLYVTGVLLGVAAVAYFGFRIYATLSPVTTAFVLLAGFAAFLVGAVGLADGSLEAVAYALAAGWYLVFVAYVLSTFDVGDGGTLLLLAGSSALFIGLGYLASRDRLRLDRSTAARVVVVIVLLSVALVGVDAVGAQPTATTSTPDEVEIPPARESVTVGTVSVHNAFLLPRRTDVPRLYACVYGTDREFIPLHGEGYPDSSILWGGETVTVAYRLPGAIFYSDGERRPVFRDRETVPVESAESCPASSGDARVLVVTNRPEPPR